MTASDYQACEDRVFAHEGSEYTDGVHPFDPGGPTRWGITIADARSFWLPTATADDVRSMPKTIAQGIYKAKYWNAVNGDQLPAGIDDCIFDYGVNSGNSRAGKVLRRLLGLPDTVWQVSGAVLIECNKRDPVTLINAICDERLQFLQSLAIWPTYKNGWTTRVKEVREYSIQLAGHAAAPVSTPLPTPPAAPSTPQAKGVHTPPDNKVPVGVGAAVTAAIGFVSTWLGTHPAITAFVLAAVVFALVMILGSLHNAYLVKQDAPVAPTIPVPAKA